ncbi:uncharacterized protein EI97DRAFT_419959 [Westerdykella ornata]|uniref:LysM domain-containing protein n=1 Tax=Westerdykella ornata TaxID=318751 RepID=A0A6A6JG56_WESOR|nr:uncharacterized protein EI97DRAFT_419959 [Westerdykella ornata]KAF2275620.1 hypothetical protein EI97DRAFT_419959 [Westerdykella ornata]
MHRINGAPSSQSTSTPTTSSLRPRARRLISIEDEYNPVEGSDTGSSTLGSRAASPIPRSHPSRPPTTSNAPSPGPKALRDTSARLSGLWGNSWSALQGLATTVLGNEGETAPRDPSGRRRRPLWDTHRRTVSNAPPKTWGPSASAAVSIGAGTQEDRESMIRALKRKDLLSRSEQLATDSVGRIKRRNSDDRASSSAPPGENEERDALVYIHHVRPQDTLAGVAIKYSCDPATLRRANRMWPNDSIQTREVVVLPVDACGVKGRPVPGLDMHQEDLLLDSDMASSKKPTYDEASPDGLGSPLGPTTGNALIPSVSHSNTETESPWKHDSWVLLPNDTKPTEIGRMPRRTLGFFPPARRKSLAYSDASASRPSFDVPRSSTSTDRPNAVSSPSQSVSNTRYASRTSSTSDLRGRQRSGSSGFMLHGPGGVGTLGKNVRSPGPAQDGLNKLLGPHLPNVAPPPGQEYFTPWAPSLLEVDSGTSVQHSGSGSRTPLSGAGLDFQEIGGAIEGWVRKVGSQASKLLSEPSTPGRGRRSAIPVLGTVGGDIGDLIELRDDAFEVDAQDSLARGRSPAAGSLTPTTQQYQSARPELNLALRDRARKGEEGTKGD